MYQLINDHVDLIVSKIDRQKEIDTYLRIRSRLPVTNVSKDQDFQREYRQYWAMNAARLQNSFYNHYFQVMEEYKGEDEVEIENILQRLHEHPTRSDGKRSLQFSFASKMLHVISPEMPVYDSMVSQFYFLPDISSEKLENRLCLALKSYEFLIREYTRIIKSGLLKTAIPYFREHFGLSDTGSYTDFRVIDILIWQFTALATKGAVRDCIFKYG